MMGRQGRRLFAAVAVTLVSAMVLLGLPLSQNNAQAQETQTIAEIAVGNAELSFLVAALTQASAAGSTDFIAAASDPNADLTVFAPTNSAFALMDQDALNAAVVDPGGLLSDLLSYHVLGSAQSGADLVAAGAATTLFGDDVAITTDASGNVFVNDAQVVIADVQASNGIVHVIDTVLVPGDDPPAGQTIAEIAAGNSDLSFLVAALTQASAAGSTDFIAAASDPTSDLTVFAPTNAAFASLDQTVLNTVLNDPAGLLTNILSYHVLGSAQSGADLVGAGSATTLLGDDVAVTVDAAGNVFINDSQVVIADVQASNGIVHVIDAVLVPADDPVAQTIAEIAVGNGDLSTLVDVLALASDQGATDFIAAVSNPDADLTVFAPTNAAFVALGQETLDAVLADPAGLLTDILSYHVLGSSQSGADLVAAGSAATLLGDSVDVSVDAAGNVFINDSQVLIADIQADNGIVHVIDAVLLPVADPPPVTIAEIAGSVDELSTLVDVLTVASDQGSIDFLAAASNPDADLTVFAPTNDAFAALGQETLDAVLADPAGLLTDILAYHVLGSAQSADNLVAAGSATTLLGEDVTVEVRGGQVYINDSLVVTSVVQAVNGIVHVIDAVLLPGAGGGDDDVISNGSFVYIISDVSGRYLDGDVLHEGGTRVDTSSSPKLDDTWELQALANGNWEIVNAKHGLLLDADSDNDVNMRSTPGPGTEWEIIELANGNYLLRTVDYDRYLDYDRDNVDTSKFARSDDEWQIVAIPS